MMRLDITTSSGVLVYEKKRLRKILRAAGGEIAAVARALIRRRMAERRKAGVTGSAPGEPPALRTGALLRGIRVKTQSKGEKVLIRDTEFHAKFLETGARGGGRVKGGGKSRNRRGAPITARLLQPRPFLSTAMEARRDSIGARIRDSIVMDIAFRKEKA